MFLLPHHVQNFFLINWLMINWHKKMKLAKEKKMAPKNATMKGDWCWSILILFQSRGGRGKEPPKLTLQTRKIDYSFQAHWERECLCVCVWTGRERESHITCKTEKQNLLFLSVAPLRSFSQYPLWSSSHISLWVYILAWLSLCWFAGLRPHIRVFFYLWVLIFVFLMFLVYFVLKG